MDTRDTLIPSPLLAPPKVETRAERARRLAAACHRIAGRRHHLDPAGMAARDLAVALHAAASTHGSCEVTADRLVLVWQMLDLLHPAPAGVGLVARFRDAHDLSRVTRRVPQLVDDLRAGREFP